MSRYIQADQLQTIIRHLKRRGTISSLEAHGVYRIRSISSRICELKKFGYKIEREERRDPAGQRYVRYHLKETPDGQRVAS